MKTLHSWLARRVFYPVNVWHKGLSQPRLAEWRARDSFTQEQVRALQGEGLKKLLIYAGAHCPFYRKRFAQHGVEPQAQDPFRELEKLPPLGKAEIRANTKDLFSDEFIGRRDLIKKATGGSTGTPLEVWGDKEDYRLNSLIIARQRSWIGWQGGMETLSIFGGFRDLPSLLTRTAKRWLINDTLINNMARENGDYDRVAGVISQFPPEAIIAYFSSLRELALALERRNKRLSGIRVAVACAEPLDERSRRHAETWLGTPIYFQYGCRELGAVAQECSHQQGYHYAQDAYVCEVLDDDHRPADYGHLTITYFGNRVLPLIRYQIGDAASLDKSRCPCGLPYWRLSVIEGRLSTMVLTPSGEQITSMVFPHLFKDYVWIREFQVEQTACDYLVIRIQRSAEGFSEARLKELDEKLLGLIGKDFRVQWLFEEPFVPVPTGKHVCFISRLQ